MVSTRANATPGRAAAPFTEIGDAALDSAPRTETSRPLDECATRPPRVLSMLSRNTKVPVTKETPSITANAVSRRRTRCPCRPLRVTCNISGHPACELEALHPFEDGGGRGGQDLIHDAAVHQEQHPVGVRRRDRIVGDHHDALPELVDGASQERQDLCAGT